MTPLRMLACLAHPDDEAFTASGVLAASTAQGVLVRLVCATCGEEGDMRQPGVATRGDPGADAAPGITALLRGAGGAGADHAGLS